LALRPLLVLLLARTAAALPCTLPNTINGATVTSDTYTDAPTSVRVTGCNKTVDGSDVTVTGDGNQVGNNTFVSAGGSVTVTGSFNDVEDNAMRSLIQGVHSI
jgi:hypothetical protein